MNISYIRHIEFYRKEFEQVSAEALGSDCDNNTSDYDSELEPE